jgi:putative transposase
MGAAVELGREVGLAEACRALGVSRASVYRRREGSPRISRPRPAPPRTLSGDERQGVLTVLHEKRFVDRAPAEIHATMLDEGRYLCSTRTMYRVLESCRELRERRNQLRHPCHPLPELVAAAPNQVWTWDITKLRGPQKWVFFYLYVLLDMFSRYVVGWLLARAESARLAEKLIEESCRKERIDRGRLTIHADRGAPMTSSTLVQLYARLGVTPSHSRPRVSNDNPYSESHFKTLKYSPEFPGRFGSLEDGLGFCRRFFPWYNGEHRHSGIGMMTPEMVHLGLAPAVRARRHQVLQHAYAAHPERFVRGEPSPAKLPALAWINRPRPKNVLLEASGTHNSALATSPIWTGDGTFAVAPGATELLVVSH